MKKISVKRERINKNLIIETSSFGNEIFAIRLSKDYIINHETTCFEIVFMGNRNNILEKEVHLVNNSIKKIYNCDINFAPKIDNIYKSILEQNKTK